jgi:hypothetical protein
MQSTCQEYMTAPCGNAIPRLAFASAGIAARTKENNDGVSQESDPQYRLHCRNHRSRTCYAAFPDPPDRRGIRVSDLARKTAEKVRAELAKMSDARLIKHGKPFASFAAPLRDKKWIKGG